MKRRTFLTWAGACMASPWLTPATAQSQLAFSYSMLSLGSQWNTRPRALINLAFEIQKRGNIPIQTTYQTVSLDDLLAASSNFLVLSGTGELPAISLDQAERLRTLLAGGGTLLFDDFSEKGDDRFYTSCCRLMNKVLPELPSPEVIPSDHSVYQSYYLLKQPRGRLDKQDTWEGWTLGRRTPAFFSPNDLLGAMEADRMGNWTFHMEIGGGFRRELCFRLGINLTYYALTLNYKKDRAFPPVIERRRRQ